MLDEYHKVLRWLISIEKIFVDEFLKIVTVDKVSLTKRAFNGR
jgi:hypothetical protein